MKLARFSALLGSAASSIAAAAAQFKQLPAWKKQIALPAGGFFLLGLAMVACDSGSSSYDYSSGLGSGAAGSAEIDSEGRVNLAILPPAGFKGTSHGETVTRFKDGTGGATVTERSEMEVVRVEPDRAVIEFQVRTNMDMWGSCTPNPDADLSKNRFCTQTLSRTGEILSSKGESPDGFSGGNWPEEPLKIGESWTSTLLGTGVNRGMTMTSKTTLRQLKTIKGRSMAVLDSEFSDRSGSWSGTLWLDLQSGQIARSESSGSGETSDGIPCTMRYTSWFVDSDGNRWVD